MMINVHSIDVHCSFQIKKNIKNSWVWLLKGSFRLTQQSSKQRKRKLGQSGNRASLEQMLWIIYSFYFTLFWYTYPVCLFEVKGCGKKPGNETQLQAAKDTGWLPCQHGPERGPARSITQQENGKNTNKTSDLHTKENWIKCGPSAGEMFL